MSADRRRGIGQRSGTGRSRRPQRREGVADQVREDPIDREPIGREDDPGARHHGRPRARGERLHDRDLDTRRGGRRPEPFRGLAEQLAGVDRFGAQSSGAGLQPLHGPELADQLFEPGRLLGDGACRPAHVVAGRGAVDEGRREPADDRQRRPQIVPQVGQQVGLLGPGTGQLVAHRVEPRGEVLDLGRPDERQRGGGSGRRGPRSPPRGSGAAGSRIAR